MTDVKFIVPPFLLAVLALTGAPLPAGAADWWRPSGVLVWDWQLADYSGAAPGVQVIDLDLFDVSADRVAALRAGGVKTICYVNAGAWEEWRDDAAAFPPEILGWDYDGWPGERWLDIRRIDRLAPILRARLDLCRAKGFDGVEPDNIDGFENETGFPLTAEDQIAFNRWLAAEAHERGLSIGLKNDPGQAGRLAGDFDWAMAEDCFAEDWCADLAPFLEAGKTVFAAEYTDRDVDFRVACETAGTLGISLILKRRELDGWVRHCP